MSDELKTRALMALALHYPKSSRTEREQALWLSDYLSDLRSVGPDTVERACAEWRRSDARAFPKVGELLKLCRQSQVPKAIGAKVQPWRELTDDEYRGLGLSAKIDYHLIAAGQCRGNAGPQWRDGQPQPPEAMPQRWHSFIARARNHEAEAGRLGQLRKESMDRREAA